MVDDKIIDKITTEAKKHFIDSKGSHGWDHVERVCNLATHISKKEGANTDVVLVSALLHDIAREKQDRLKGGICHAEEGAKIAQNILEKYDFSQEFIDNVVHSIAVHRYRTGLKPKTLEAKILRDADKLDSIGAIGLGRAFMFAGEIGSKLHNPKISEEPFMDRSYTVDDTAYQEYLFKLSKIGEYISTQEGKRIAEERLKFMKDFFMTLNREYKGLE